jgi:surface polysaccharide O-acyltransferase-like enzyme
MFTKLKFLGSMLVASSLIFQAFDVHGWWWSFQHVEKNIYGLDLVVVVIASTCLLFVLVCF